MAFLEVISRVRENIMDRRQIIPFRNSRVYLHILLRYDWYQYYRGKNSHTLWCGGFMTCENGWIKLLWPSECGIIHIRIIPGSSLETICEFVSLVVFNFQEKDSTSDGFFGYVMLWGNKSALNIKNRNTVLQQIMQCWQTLNDCHRDTLK